MSAVSNSIAVTCVSNSEKIVSESVVRVPMAATIADLKAAMGKSVQVLIAGAVPSDSASIADLAAAYGSNNELRVNYSAEGRFGAAGDCAVCTVLGGGAQWS